MSLVPLSALPGPLLAQLALSLLLRSSRRRLPLVLAALLLCLVGSLSLQRRTSALD
jgi:hypothetical protein